MGLWCRLTLLNITSNERGKIPAVSGDWLPCTVYVFHEFVTPYANNRQSCSLTRKSLMSGMVDSSKKTCCGVFGGKTRENENVESVIGALPCCLLINFTAVSD